MKFQLLNKRAVFHGSKQTEDNNNSSPNDAPWNPTFDLASTSGRISLPGHVVDVEQSVPLSDQDLRPPTLSTPTPLERRSSEPIPHRPIYNNLPIMSTSFLAPHNTVSEQTSVQRTSSCSSYTPTTPIKSVSSGNQPIRPRKSESLSRI